MRRLGVLLLALVLLSAAKPAASTSTFTGTGGYSDIQQPVEQQSPNFVACGPPAYSEPCDPSTWVTNPTGCPWDADDVVIEGGAGTVSGTVGLGNCAIADGYWHKHVYAAVTAPSAGLTVVLTNSLGLSWTLVPVPDGHGFRWSTCFRDTTGTPGLPESYPVVPDSNGGRGIRADYVLTMTAGGHAVRNVNAGLWIYGTYTPYSTPC